MEVLHFEAVLKATDKLTKYKNISKGQRVHDVFNTPQLKTHIFTAHMHLSDPLDLPILRNLQTLVEKGKRS